jgi:hypothetical protein
MLCGRALPLHGGDAGVQLADHDGFVSAADSACYSPAHVCWAEILRAHKGQQSSASNPVCYCCCACRWQDMGPSATAEGASQQAGQGLGLDPVGGNSARPRGFHRATGLGVQGN